MLIIKLSLLYKRNLRRRRQIGIRIHWHKFLNNVTLQMLMQYETRYNRALGILRPWLTGNISRTVMNNGAKNSTESLILI